MIICFVVSGYICICIVFLLGVNLGVCFEGIKVYHHQKKMASTSKLYEQVTAAPVAIDISSRNNTNVSNTKSKKSSTFALHPSSNRIPINTPKTLTPNHTPGHTIELPLNYKKDLRRTCTIHSPKIKDSKKTDTIDFQKSKKNFKRNGTLDSPIKRELKRTATMDVASECDPIQEWASLGSFALKSGNNDKSSCLDIQDNPLSKSHIQMSNTQWANHKNNKSINQNKGFYTPSRFGDRNDDDENPSETSLDMIESIDKNGEYKIRLFEKSKMKKKSTPLHPRKEIVSERVSVFNPNSKKKSSNILSTTAACKRRRVTNFMANQNSSIRVITGGARTSQEECVWDLNCPRVRASIFAYKDSSYQ